MEAANLIPDHRLDSVCYLITRPESHLIQQHLRKELNLYSILESVNTILRYDFDQFHTDRTRPLSQLNLIRLPVLPQTNLGQYTLQHGWIDNELPIM